MTISSETERSAADVLAQPTCDVNDFRTLVFPCAKNSVYAAIRRGEIAHVKVGKTIRIITAPWREKLGLGSVKLT
jgi:hypothetical protein